MIVRMLPSRLVRFQNQQLHNYDCTLFCRALASLEAKSCEESAPKSAPKSKPRHNALGIQMLSPGIHRQVFREKDTEQANKERQEKNILESIKHLKDHGLWGKEPSTVPDVDFKLPKMFGKNVDEHFRVIAEEQSKNYRNLAVQLASGSLPTMPKKWAYKVGWTKYSFDGTYESVDFPDEEALVFDVEVCVPEGSYPTLAVAASNTAWYSWCSERLVENKFSWSQRMFLNDLIPMETKYGQTKPPGGQWKERIIVGHNVSYDRALIKEQYLLKGSKTRFLDTMSLHIATSGITSFQRSLLLTEGTDSKRKDVQEAKSKMGGVPTKDWMHVGSLNNLGAVHQLYCGGPELNKEKRNIFVSGSISDIRSNFDDLMSYCADDVRATCATFQKVLPMFFERFPHPVTLAGMLEMSVAYLPVNQNWERYLRDAQSTYDDLEQEMKMALMHLANEACELLHDSRYENDPWLWDLDWSVQNVKVKKMTNKTSNKTKAKVQHEEEGCESVPIKTNVKEGFPRSLDDTEIDEDYICPNETVKKILGTVDKLYKSRPVLPGYPAWYRKLCTRVENDDKDWVPGPALISTQMQIAPKLLRLTWDGYSLHFDRKHGWGYLIPKKMNGDQVNSPADKLHPAVPSATVYDTEELWEKLEKGIGDPVELGKLWHATVNRRPRKNKKKQPEVNESAGPTTHHGIGPMADVDVRDSWFYRLPHKNGAHLRVGNPLAKDFLNKIEDGTLKAKAGMQAELVLRLGKTINYWRNNHKRIESQLVIWLRKSDLPRPVSRHADYEDDHVCGAIIPQIVTAGTVTRRAVEPTWLTASNAYVDRVGSELKSMIQAPPGYHFVGADVDSQELWIAAILGDANFAKEHGCTALGWMTLQGKKSNGSDMHSRTANTVGVSRDQAKVINYGRIYGAGQPFAQQLLMQFNHRISSDDAKNKAQVMFAATKGIKGYILNEFGKELYKSTYEHATDISSVILSKGDVLKLLFDSHSSASLQDVINKSVWMGGTESAMFNKLEEIAEAEEPATPVLGCRISRALEPQSVNKNFMTSRVNWVVQSSAVDYLHLMLVCMKWLCSTYQIDGRFSISIHDEVRYLVKSEDKYRAALALQITNLLTRSIFAHQLGMTDLPQSVAFFSAVDIDNVLRKEVTMDCKTPSNPHGLNKGYGIPPGHAFDIYSILKITNGNLKKL